MIIIFDRPPNIFLLWFQCVLLRNSQMISILQLNQACWRSLNRLKSWSNSLRKYIKDSAIRDDCLAFLTGLSWLCKLTMKHSYWLLTIIYGFKILLDGLSLLLTIVFHYFLQMPPICFIFDLLSFDCEEKKSWIWLCT